MESARRDDGSSPAAPDPVRRRGSFVAFIVLSAAVILSVQLLVPPVIGLSNNGDFEKIMGVVGLEYPGGITPEQKYFRYATTTLVFGRPNWWKSGFHTSETILVRGMMIPARVRSGGTKFDIRWLGAAHGFLFLLCFAAIGRALVRWRPSDPFVALTVGLLVFTDVGYAAPMNTLYSQEASYLAFFGILAVLATAVSRGRFTFPLAAAYFGCAAFFVTSKPQEAPQAAVLALAGLWMLFPQGRWPRLWAVVGAAALLGAGLAYFGRIAPGMRAESLRQVVFDELIRHSPQPRRDLLDLGLDPSWAGKDARSFLHDPVFERRFFARIDYPRLARFYASHPAQLADAFGRAARAGMILRPPGFGDLAESAGRPARSTSQAFALWSSARKTAAPAGPVLLIAIFGGAIVAAARGLGRGDSAGSLACKSVLLIVVMGVVDFGVCGIATSHTEIERHLFVFDAVTDTLLIIGLSRGVVLLSGRRPRAAPVS